MHPLFALLAGFAVLGAIWFSLFCLVGFASQRSRDYAAALPAFDIRSELNGPILCEGVIFGPTGRAHTRFVGDMEAVWQGDRCRMTEHFRYLSGTEQHRCWHLVMEGANRFRAEADDLAAAGSGRQDGNAVHLRYRIRLPASAGGYVLSVSDWMYLTPNGTIINRSQFRKYGFKVAELIATMRRVPA